MSSRSDTDYAVEFGRYLATAAEQFMADLKPSGYGGARSRSGLLAKSGICHSRISQAC